MIGVAVIWPIIGVCHFIKDYRYCGALTWMKILMESRPNNVEVSWSLCKLEKQRMKLGWIVLLF